MKFFVIALLVFLILLVVYLWKRRLLYYYSYRLQGPFSLPLIGSPTIVFAGQKNFFKRFRSMTRFYSSVYRLWITNRLYIVTSRPKDAELILNSRLKKENIFIYEFLEFNFSSIISQKYDKWKIHRKIINPAFNTKIINSLIPIINNNANRLVVALNEECEEPLVEMLPVIWKFTQDNIIETLTTEDPQIIADENSKMLEMIVRLQEMVNQRSFNALYFFNICWKISPLYKETRKLLDYLSAKLKKEILRYKQSKKYLATKEEKYLSNVLLASDLTMDSMIGELFILLSAGSETTAITMVMTLLMLSLYPHIQEKLFQEITTIIGDTNKEITLQHINQMDYLDRVIKETLRIMPVVPLVARYIDKEMEIDGQVYPQDSVAIINIWKLHRDPKYWPDPYKFDPDRFLPEEVKKRPRCSYIPFSHGSRNCVGMTLGLMNMKIFLAKILREFKIQEGEYKSLKEVEDELAFAFIVKPEKPIRLSLKRIT